MPEETQAAPEEQEPEPPSQPENDFMAGAMMANGISFVWLQALAVFRQYVSQIPERLLVDLSFVIYVFAGYVASRQVVKRAKREHLKAGLKTAGYSAIMGLLISSTLPNYSGLNLGITLGVCYVTGCILGAYMITRDRLRQRRVEASS